MIIGILLPLLVFGLVFLLGWWLLSSNDRVKKRVESTIKHAGGRDINIHAVGGDEYRYRIQVSYTDLDGVMQTPVAVVHYFFGFSFGKIRWERPFTPPKLVKEQVVAEQAAEIERLRNQLKRGKV